MNIQEDGLSTHGIDGKACAESLGNTKPSCLEGIRHPVPCRRADDHDIV